MEQERMNQLIPERLRQIEAEHGVKVLLAVESGSRAWGFASPDSDFDVRFIYVRPRDFYLQLQDTRDVIETPIDDVWDVSGWDLDKTLKLLHRSNPTVFEWMSSPIVYLETDFKRRIQPLLSSCFCAKRTLYHYVSMAKRNVRTYLEGDEVQPKKYFYMLRPALACQWIMDRDCPPPMLFSQLADAELPQALRPSVERLLDLKMNGPEKLKIPRVSDVDDYLEDTLSRVDAHIEALPKPENQPWAPLNAFFLEELNRL